MCRHRPEWPAALCPMTPVIAGALAAALSTHRHLGRAFILLTTCATLRSHSPSYPASASILDARRELATSPAGFDRARASVSRSTTDEDKIEFRDGIHGLLVWALAVAWAPCWRQRQRQRVPWPRPRRCLQACQTRRPTSRSLPTTLTACCAASTSASGRATGGPRRRGSRCEHPLRRHSLFALVGIAGEGDF